jgi:hypothetical protein
MVTPVMHIAFWIPLLAIFATAPGGARAAEFTAHRYTDGPGAYIIGSGETMPGDYHRFLAVLPRAIAYHRTEDYPIDVWLDGPGGDLDEALKLGRLIYDLGFTTLVDDHSECASACALIWLGGGALAMRPRAMIGFHQAAYLDGTSAVTGNAVVGHYLADVGLDQSVVEYVMSAPPNSMTWLSPEVVRSLRMPVDILDR